MRWNWQQPDWPRFRWDQLLLARAEAMFLQGAGVLIGVARHLDGPAHEQVLVEAMSVEAVTTSEIEGEMLNRASVQSSIQRQLGLATDRRRASRAEQGISELMVSLYRTADQKLTRRVLFDWHSMAMSGRSDFHDVGCYRASSEPMQVVSGAMHAPKVHFEAPPSARVAEEMSGFLDWFNDSAPGRPGELPALTRAGIAHLYFESIHPFEDGNGRVGRAIAEKALVQGFGQPVMIALARSILAHHRAYYVALEAANKKNDVTDWQRWFAAVALEAQQRTLNQVEFVVHKTKLLDTLREILNDRQRKVLLRMFREGPDGFAGGLSAKNYSTIAGASSATATRDLAGLVEAGALTRSGERKGTRYTLNVPTSQVSSIHIEKNGDVRVRESLPSQTGRAASGSSYRSSTA